MVLSLEPCLKPFPLFSSEQPLHFGNLCSSPERWVCYPPFILLTFLLPSLHRTLLGERRVEASSTILWERIRRDTRNLMVFFSFGVSAGVWSLAEFLITRYFLPAIVLEPLGLQGFYCSVLGGWGKSSGAILEGFVLGIAGIFKFSLHPFWL